MTFSTKTQILVVKLGFQLLGCILFAYGICIAGYYTSSNRINDGSFFVSYSQFITLVICSGFSGFHFNFSVSIAFFLKKGSNFTFIQLILYMLTQFFGFFMGGLLCWGLQDRVNSPQQLSGNFQDFLAEIVATFLYVLFVLLITGQHSHSQKVSTKFIIIPLVLFICRTMAFHTQSLNPTLAMGLGLVYCMYNTAALAQWKYSWVILCGPAIGGALASLFYSYMYVPILNHTKETRKCGIFEIIDQ